MVIVRLAGCDGALELGEECRCAAAQCVALSRGECLHLLILREDGLEGGQLDTPAPLRHRQGLNSTARDTPRMQHACAKSKNMGLDSAVRAHLTTGPAKGILARRRANARHG